MARGRNDGALSMVSLSHITGGRVAKVVEIVGDGIS
jgi:hypothetical protein